ncbi:hypothetical protein CHS0354_035294 [Potamilus streckersoni]|uniref:ABC transporter domain-containing protein n=1 Tax=Potamilus streckersoni TaxID=2493646 RepID=A0AAE0S349_9BIVA|nr:hypothetical protein CHS0354_035294 [Potamilus streckersoni]
MIETISLTKKYGSLTAVDNVSFKAEPGEVVAFLGPNGAGKSTTMRMITGYIYPTAGTVKIMGRDTEEDPAESRRHIGLVAGIRGIAKADIEARVRDALKTAFLEDVENRIIDTLSKGYRQRVCFAQAIIHNPPVLILDEPTDGLDPNQKNEIRHPD